MTNAILSLACILPSISTYSQQKENCNPLEQFFGKLSSNEKEYAKFYLGEIKCMSYEELGKFFQNKILAEFPIGDKDTVDIKQKILFRANSMFDSDTAYGYSLNDDLLDPFHLSLCFQVTPVTPYLLFHEEKSVHALADSIMHTCEEIIFMHKNIPKQKISNLIYIVNRIPEQKIQMQLYAFFAYCLQKQDKYSHLLSDSLLTKISLLDSLYINGLLVNIEQKKERFLWHLFIAKIDYTLNQKLLQSSIMHLQNALYGGFEIEDFRALRIPLILAHAFSELPGDQATNYGSFLIRNFTCENCKSETVDSVQSLTYQILSKTINHYIETDRILRHTKSELSIAYQALLLLIAAKTNNNKDNYFYFIQYDLLGDYFQNREEYGKAMCFYGKSLSYLLELNGPLCNRYLWDVYNKLILTSVNKGDYEWVRKSILDTNLNYLKKFPRLLKYWTDEQKVYYINNLPQIDPLNRQTIENYSFKSIQEELELKYYLNELSYHYLNSRNTRLYIKLRAKADSIINKADYIDWVTFGTHLHSVKEQWMLVEEMEKTKLQKELAENRSKILYYSVIFTFLLIILVTIAFYQKRKVTKLKNIAEAERERASEQETLAKQQEALAKEQEVVAKNLAELAEYKSKIWQEFGHISGSALLEAQLRLEEQLENYQIKDTELTFSTLPLFSLQRLLRNLFTNLQLSTVALSQELELAKGYVLHLCSIKEKYIKFEIKGSIPEIEIPPAILLSCVKNTVKHGGLLRLKEGKIAIELKSTGSEYYCSIYDNGSGFPEHYKTLSDITRGTGLKNANSLLSYINNSNCDSFVTFSSSDIEGYNTRVTLLLRKL